MTRNPLLEKLNDGSTSLGLYINSADMVELCGHLGLDWFLIDQMWTSNDWSKTEEMIRAGEASEITPVVRVQSNPWLGYDHRLAIDVARALGIGAQFVFVSHSGKQEIEECVEASRGWHKRIMTIHPYRNFDEWETVLEQQTAESFVIPQPETQGALESLEEVIASDGVRIVFIGMTDASRIITGSHTPDFYNPALWEYVDQAVAMGEENGVVIGANTSYAYSLAEIQKRAQLLHDRGVRMIMLQGAPFLFQIAMTEFLESLRPSLR